MARRICLWWSQGLPNLGDDLNEVLLPSYGINIAYGKPSEADVIGIGSILDVIPSSFPGTILGSGLMWAQSRKQFPQARFVLVRGQLTAERISTPQPIQIGDPGLLVGRLLGHPSQTRFTLGLVPHYIDKGNPIIEKLASRYPTEIKIIDIQSPIRDVLLEISSCEYIASSSLHGLITADALGKPNIWLSISGNVLGKGYKFHDYFSAFEPEPPRKVIEIDGSEALSHLISQMVRPGSAVQERIDKLDQTFCGLTWGLLKQPERDQHQALIQEVTETVRFQYELFPHPVHPIETSVVLGHSFPCIQSYILAQYARCHRLLLPKGKRVLSAGCGTGYELQTLFHLNPGLEEIIGFDLSETSIQIARERIGYHRLNNCQAITGNLMELNTLPEGVFDFILCSDVLSHVADIKVALQNLAQKLTPQGVIGISLSSTVAGQFLTRLRGVLRRLGVYQWSLEESIPFIRKLLTHSVPGTPLHDYARSHQVYFESDENLVDQFFHIIEGESNISDSLKLVQDSSLSLLRDLPPEAVWSPQQVIDPEFTDFYGLYRKLSPLSQLELSELLDPDYHSQHVFWCCRQGSGEEVPLFDLGRFKEYQWQLNPVFENQGEIQLPLAWVGMNSDPVDPYHTSPQVQVKWPYFLNPNRSGSFPLSDFQDLLLPLRYNPRSGSEILKPIDESQHNSILERFKQWESHRIILRV